MAVIDIKLQAGLTKPNLTESDLTHSPFPFLILPGHLP